MSTLYYIHDPMCSWCWAFRPVWLEILSRLPQGINTRYLLGGLAPDNNTAMDKVTQSMIQEHWQTIEKKVPNTEFNFDFWEFNSPKRSTYPACRAVIAAREQQPSKEDAMILAIQKAYYLNAQNPSEDDTLFNCATSIDLDLNPFQEDLHSPHCQNQLNNDIQMVRAMQVYRFPSLVLEQQETFKPITIDYNNADVILNQLNS